MYKMLRLVLEQPNTGLFQDCVSALLENLSADPRKEEFHDYFIQDWIPTKENWAFCYRLGLGINTNMFVEAFHRVFKRIYLGGKVNKRVDSCLVNLLRFARDQCFGRVIQLTKGKANYRVNAIYQHHRRSLSLPVENVQSSGENVLSIKSSDGKNVYEVQRVQDQCPEHPACRLSCQECNICVHLYVCNCPDSLILHTICKHIHLVQRSLSLEANEMKGKTADSISAEGNENYDQEEVERLTRFAQIPNQVDVASVRNRVTRRLSDLQGLVSQSINTNNLTQLEREADKFRIQPLSRS